MTRTSMMIRRIAGRRGAAKTEYIIIIVLVSLAVIAGVVAYGSRVQDRYTDTIVETKTKVRTDAP